MRELKFSGDTHILVTADLHYNHRKIIGYCRRPWLYLDTDNRRREENKAPYEVSDRALAAHDNALVEGINSVSTPDTVLFIVGDVAWGEAGKGGLAKLKELRDKLIPRVIYVIIGNHDDEDDLVTVFGAPSVFERVRIAVDGPGGVRKAVLDHYPGHSWELSHHGGFQLYGHVHGNLDRRHEADAGWALSLDVGVDSHDYRPWDWHKEIVPLMDRRRATWQAWRDKIYGTPKELGGMAVPKRTSTPIESSPTISEGDNRADFERG